MYQQFDSTGSELHPTAPETKADKLNVVPRLMDGAFPPLPLTSSGHGAQLSTLILSYTLFSRLLSHSVSGTNAIRLFL